MAGKDLMKHCHLKKYFYSELNKEDISNEDYVHELKVWDTFTIKDFGEYHDLFVQTDTLLLADVFENFRDMCIRIYKHILCLLQDYHRKHG